MNVILLSGGSGKRLWPLSNDIRSKQFIKLFRDEDGNDQSMIQRVYAQILKADPQAKITIATGESQVSAIRNQLSEEVGICVEPCRRDTFPAIVLASAYLVDELGVSPEESVVVCPVDPYVEDSYYDHVCRLAALAQEGVSNLMLMGIEPTYPSDKYGYMIPENREEVCGVREFKEKPDVETAKGYLRQGALWNAGVFAFRLQYLLDRAHSMLDFADYRDLYAKYESLPKISFDYAVVEKEQDISVLRYAGDWKDVGTWNMMSEVMTEVTKGKVVTDDACRNTNVVNELDIPIICMGCRDMVVAASCDGILVAEKEQSGNLKKYVDQVEQEVRFAEKSWGTYTVIDAQPGSLTVKAALSAGSSMNYHSHELRDEVWTVISGTGTAIVDEMEQKVRPGDVISMAAGCRHTIMADTDMCLVEVQVGSEISEKDKIIYEFPGVAEDGTNTSEAGS